MAEYFGRHPDAEIYLSQPGLALVLSARILGEFGDDADRYQNARARKNYSGQSPITRASGKKTVVIARYATNRRLGDALHTQAFSALQCSPGARRYYDDARDCPVPRSVPPLTCSYMVGLTRFEPATP
ncbi:hypothetical protein Kisp01_69560 [Kineosporia sp. NBRC 101677]|uniref:transposase n=1 Tax=Kineosporia sp. NBRC 101677 TaxID=3032197 RepID=UPI0024A277BF|nr:hypothetical protein Kisp01_69560 [Kineosporia sp. NBRC 101677]